MGKTKLVASSECFMFIPTDNQASGVKRCVQEAYRVSLSEAERHKSATSTSSSTILPPSSARFAASVPHIFVKTRWMSAPLVGVVSTELAAGAVSVFVEADVSVGVDPELDADGGVEVDTEVDVDVEVDLEAAVEIDAEVDIDAGVDVMVKWMLSACSIICFS